MEKMVDEDEQGNCENKELDIVSCIKKGRIRWLRHFRQMKKSTGKMNRWMGNMDGG